MTDKILNENDYKKILERRFNREDLKFIKSLIKPLSKNVEGFMGEHYTLEITYDENGEEKVEYFFIKTIPTKNKVQEYVTKAFNMYESEIFLYDVLFREFDKHGFDTSFSPKCYFCVPGKTLVMQDLTRDGFTLPVKKKWFNVVEVQCGLRSLAKFHAAGYMYEDIKSKELGRTYSLIEEYPEIFREKLFTHYLEFRNTYGEQWINASLEVYRVLIDHLPKSEVYKNEFRRRLDQLEIGKNFAIQTKIKKTVGHGDLWSNNMFFKRVNNIAVQCVLVDYQTNRYNFPAYDVLIYIHSNTNSEFRNKHLEDLKEFYYECLSETFQEHGYSVEDFYPKEDYEESIRLAEVSAIFQVFADHMLLFLPTETLNSSVNDEQNVLQELFFTDRVSSALKAFENDEFYRQVVLDHMYDLYKNLKA